MIAGVGAVLILAGLFVPSALWVAWLGTPSQNLQGELLLGASLFRAGLEVVGWFLIAGWKWRWWGAGPPTVARSSGVGLRDPILLGILALAVVLRIYRLNDGLWLDEILTLVNYARLPFGVIATSFDSENQHFMFSLLAHGSTGIFGESAWALRLPSVAFGVAAVWALYGLANEVVGRREALLSAAFLSVSYHHVWFSQNARGYSGVLFWTLLSTWIFLRAWSLPRSRLWWWYAVAAALGVYTHLTMVFVVIAHFLIYVGHLCFRRQSGFPEVWVPVAGGFILSGLLTFVLYSFGLPQFFGTWMAEPSEIATWKNPLWALSETIRSLGLGAGKGLVGLAAVGVLVTGIYSYARTRPIVVALLILPVVLTTAAAFGMGHHLWPRTVFFAAGFGVMVLVRGLVLAGEWLGRLADWQGRSQTRLGTGLAGFGILVSAATLSFVYGPKQDFVGARDFIESRRESGDAVVSVGLAVFPYQKYYAPEWQTAGDAAQIHGIEAESVRTWVVSTFPPQMESVHPDIVEVLRREFDLIAEFPGSLGGGTVFVYRSGRASADSVGGNR